MKKQKTRRGRPPLSETEKSVPTVIRLLPSVKNAIKSEAERQDVTVSELLRDIVEERVVQTVRKDEVSGKWNEQVFRDLVDGNLEIKPKFKCAGALKTPLKLWVQTSFPPDVLK